MKKSAFTIYIGYVWMKTLIGLTFHPYKSVLETFRHPVIFPVIFSPCVGLIAILIMAKLGSLLISVYGMQRELIAIFLSTALISILFWQILLFYFLTSFLFASWQKHL
jgi:hypothetical protein